VLLALALGIVFGQIAAAADDFPQTVPVSQTYNHASFSYKILSRETKTGFSVCRLSYPSPVVTRVPQNNTIPAEYYLPDGIRPGDPRRPAVICLHILDGNMELVRATCSVLASRGVPAMLFLLPYYGPRAPPGGPQAMAHDPQLFLTALDQATEDVRRSVDLLASRPEIDPRHIGITGISLGGIVAATAAGREPRLWRAVLVLTGGDLLTIIRHARETRELRGLIDRLPGPQKTQVQQSIEAVDPLRSADRLRDRALAGKVLMVNAGEDEVIPRACTEKLAAALGIEKQVVWLPGLGHYTAMAELPRLLRMTADFFAQDLPPGTRLAPPAATGRPEQVVAAILQHLASLIGQPRPGRCDLVDVDVSVATNESKGATAGPSSSDSPALAEYAGHTAGQAGSGTQIGKPFLSGRLRLLRGSAQRFRLELTTDKFGEAALGQGSFPWMIAGGRSGHAPTAINRSTIAGGKTLFKGVLQPGPQPGDPFAFVDPRNCDRLRMVAGAAAAMALAPDVLDEVAEIRDSSSSGQPRRLTIVPKRKGKELGRVELELDADGKSPKSASFDVSGLRGAVMIHAWQFDAPAEDAMFEPPAGLSRQEVSQEDLQRMISGLLNFAIDNVQ
jgi:dienelactone hydrolase